MIHRIVESYGTDPAQVGEWFLPEVDSSPLVIIIHGGFWRPIWRRDIELATSLDLAEHGFAVFSIEYRTYEHPWPSTLLDVAAAIDHAVSMSAVHRVDGSRRGIYGHSAGGGLALWATSRRALPTDAPGANEQAPIFDVVLTHAPVAALALASADHLGEGAVDTMMGGRPQDVPDRYAVTDPLALIPDPAGRRVLLHGDQDPEVPLSQSQAYAQHAAAHDAAVELIVRPGEGHYEILDPGSAVSALRREMLAHALRD